MEIIGLVLASIIGITLGMMGSGGSILTVPVLVYLFHVDPSLATTYSLFAIGISAFIGSIRNYVHKKVDIQKVLSFGIPSVIVVFITRQFILPLIPDEFVIGSLVIHQNVLLMILFAVIMVLSAFHMIKGQSRVETTKDPKPSSLYTTILQGALVGFVTGVVGAGGGFLIIPALINFYKMPMKLAVSTSLAIIFINSLFGIIGDSEKFVEFDWNLIGSYTGLLIIGMFLGFYLSKYFSSEQLKKGLGYLILVMGCFILVKELLLK